MNEQENTIKSLVGGGGQQQDASFSSEASRVGKRTRASNDAPPSSSSQFSSATIGGSFSFLQAPRAEEGVSRAETGGEAWDMFNSLMRNEAPNTYY